jgi:predicted alpha/beta superfamily hydrolase
MISDFYSLRRPRQKRNVSDKNKRLLPVAKFLFFVLFVSIISGCTPQSKKTTEPTGKENVITTIRLYSKFVNDAYFISISMPQSYYAGTKKKYPVVYLLDGNLYFDIMAATLKKYSEVGLVPEVILVGVGYKDLPALDSLRNRDDTFPLAAAEYEMSISGGAPEFLSFITQELFPFVDNRYPADTTERILMGHSLGGYFTAFALWKMLEKGSACIHGFIAASPSLHYNKYYLLEQLKNVPASSARVPGIKAYITFGGLEDHIDDAEDMRLRDVESGLTKFLNKGKFPFLEYKSDLFSNLDHMDTQLPTFIKGLQWILTEQQEVMAKPDNQ